METSFIDLISNVKFLIGLSVAFLILFFAIIFYKLDRSTTTKFSFEAMFLDENGKTSSTKFAQNMVLALSSWGFVVLILMDKLTEWYFGLYMAAWVLNRGVTKFLESFEKKEKPPVVS